MVKKVAVWSVSDTMRDIFPQSRELRETVERHGWNLYDMTDQPEGRAYSWDEINRMSHAEQFEVYHNYMFIPKPKAGQTLRDAYAVTKGFGPSLVIDDPNDDR